MSECLATPPVVPSSLTQRVRLGDAVAVEELIELLPILPPGPDTAALLLALPDTGDRLVQSLVLQAWDRHLSWAQAMVYGAAQPFACSDDPERSSLEQVRHALGLSAHGARNVQAISKRLFTLFASTLGLLQRGQISRGHVWGLIETTADLDDHEAGQIEDLVIAEAPGQTIAEFRRALDRARLTVCPQNAQQRHDSKVAARQVSRWRDKDGMGRILAELPPEDIAAAWQALCRRADEIAQPDDPRARPARLADALVEAITGVPAANDPRRRPDTPTTPDDVCEALQPTATPQPAEPAEPGAPAQPVDSSQPVDSLLPAEPLTGLRSRPAELTDPAEQVSGQTGRRASMPPVPAPDPADPVDPADQPSGQTARREQPHDDKPAALDEPAAVSPAPVPVPAADPASASAPSSAQGVPGDEVEIHVVVPVAQMRGQPDTNAPPDIAATDIAATDNAAVSPVVVPLAPRRVRRALTRGTSRRGRRLSSQLWAVIGLDGLLGNADVPGEISTFGAVPASVVRRMAQGPVLLRRLVIDEHGRLLDAEHTITLPAGAALAPALDGLLTAPYRTHPLDYGSTVYRLPADLDRHVVLRDRTCTVPGCGQPAMRCDGEHAIPWPDGATSEDNCGAMCRWHHRLKTHRGWTVQRQADGSVLWTSPDGLTRRRRSFDYTRYIS